MSLVFVGDHPLCCRIFRCISNYQDLCSQIESNGTFELPGDELPEKGAKLIRLENKYYKADVDVSFNDSVDSITEALIIISHDMELDFFSSKYEDIAAHAKDNDLNLRLFVTIHTEEVPQIAREKFLNWSLDYGFEHIEIVLNNLMEDHLSRDKVGLPRLMEALQSTMWSSIGKAKPEVHTVATAVVAPETHQIQSKLNDSDMEDDETDLNLFDSFASALAEAKKIREQARTGGIDDDERRKRAADMAMKLMEMLNLDDDDDDDE